MPVPVLQRRVVLIVLLGVAIQASIVSAESQPIMDTQADSATLSSSRETRTLPNLSPEEGWPSPVNDRENRLFTLIDVLEHRPKTSGGEHASDYRWDIEGWYGGDYHRLWFKSEGQQDTAFKADYDVDFQVLYGRFIRKYYDFQIGPRVETQTYRGNNVTRGLGVIGIQGLVPYNYELEAALFIDQNGKVSGRLAYQGPSADATADSSRSF